MVAVSFTGGGNRSTRRKSPTYAQVTDKLYHKMLYRVHVCVILCNPNHHERDDKMKKCYFNHDQREPIDSIETMVMYLIFIND